MHIAKTKSIDIYIAVSIDQIFLEPAIWYPSQLSFNVGHSFPQHDRSDFKHQNKLEGKKISKLGYCALLLRHI